MRTLFLCIAVTILAVSCTKEEVQPIVQERKSDALIIEPMLGGVIILQSDDADFVYTFDSPVKVLPRPLSVTRVEGGKEYLLSSNSIIQSGTTTIQTGSNWKLVVK